jgi:hypothetical protein
MIDYIGKLELKGSVLLLTEGNDLVLQKSCENINKVEVMEASSINAYRLIRPKNIVIPVKAVEKIQSLWGDSEFKTVTKSKTVANKKTTSPKKTSTRVVKKDD